MAKYKPFKKLMALALSAAMVLGMNQVNAFAQIPDLSIGTSSGIGIMPLASTASTIDLSDPDTDLSSGATASGGKYSYDDSTKIITIYSGPVTVTGTTTDRQVVVDGTVDVTLDNANINVSAIDYAAAFKLESGADVTLTLVGTNSLNSGPYMGGVHVPIGTSLTIQASDANQKLTAYCGGSNGSGIGGGYWQDAGTIKITGGAVIASSSYGGAGIGGGTQGSGGTVIISGGVVTATGNNTSAGIGGGIFGSGGTVTITGGSVKASSIQSTPTDGNGNTVYLGKLLNQSGVTSVSVDEVLFWIDGNHDGDNDLYLYMTGEAHNVDVETGSPAARYEAAWTGSGFTWDTGTSQPTPGSTSVSLSLAPNPVIYGAGSVTATATVTDSSLGTRSLNVVGFYLGNNLEPFASSPVISGVATATLDISSLSIGDHQIKAIYGGSFGGTVSSDTATLHIVVNAETPNITGQPQSAIYNQGGTATPLSVSVSITDGGTLSYQWYKNTSNSNAGGSPVGTNSASYTPDTGTAGTIYYYCVVTNTNTSVSGTQTATATSSIATITVNSSSSQSTGSSDRSSSSSKQDALTVLNPQSITLAQVMEAYRKALPNAANGVVTAKLSGWFSELDLSIQQTLAKQAEKDGVVVKLQISQVQNFTTVARLTMNPVEATAKVQLMASTTNPNAVNREAFFKRWFSNKLFAVATGQEGSYGQPVEVVVKPELTGMGAKNLVFYSYDKKTNVYKRIEKPAYLIDGNGYLHFSTEMAGEVIMSDEELKKK